MSLSVQSMFGAILATLLPTVTSPSSSPLASSPWAGHPGLEAVSSIRPAHNTFRPIASAQTQLLSTVPATAIALCKDRICVGSSDGSLRVFTASTGAHERSFDAASNQPVSLLAASNAGVAWVVGGRPAGIRDPAGADPAAGEQGLMVWLTGRTQALKIDLKPAGVSGPVRGLAWIGSRLAILQEFGAVFFDAKAGAIVLPESFLSPSLASLAEHDRMWVGDGSQDTQIVLFAHPHALRRSPLTQGSPYVSLLSAFRVKGDVWKNLGGVATSALDVVPTDALVADEDGKIKPGATFKVVSETIGIGSYGVSAIESDNFLTVPLTKAGWETARHPLALWAADRSSAADPLWYGQTANSAWWWTGSVLMQQEFETGAAHAYLPVRLADAHVNAIVADDAGLWIATDAGVRRLDPALPDASFGFGGFVRLPLGPDTLKTQTADQWKLAQEIYKWRFAPAEKAGADSAIMVSKVFEALGLSVAATRAALLAGGRDVLDELQFGDVLVFAKSVAIYVGDGHTVEVRDGTVRNGDVWGRQVIRARRLLKTG